MIPNGTSGKKIFTLIFAAMILLHVVLINATRLILDHTFRGRKDAR